MFRWLICFAVFLTHVPGAAWSQAVKEGTGEVVCGSSKSAKSETSPDLDKAVAIIIERTNAFRDAEGLGKLAIDPKLKDTSEYFAKFMARTGKYGHDADENMPAARAAKHGYDYCVITENIAYQFHPLGFKTDVLADKFFEGWKNSPSHRKNMLDADVTDTGVAIAQSEKTGYYYAVQMFGRPRSKMIEFQIGNLTETPIEYKYEDRPFPLPPDNVRTHRSCRSADVVFQFADDKSPRVIRPENGAEFSVILDKEGKFRVTRKRSSK